MLKYNEVSTKKLIKYYEIFKDERNFSFIMENCSGGKLFQNIVDKLSKGESFSEKGAVPIFKQLMRPSVIAIFYRDIKPENILFLNKKPDSKIKIIDFGLCEIFGEIKPLMIIILETI